MERDLSWRDKLLSWIVLFSYPCSIFIHFFDDKRPSEWVMWVCGVIPIVTLVASTPIHYVFNFIFGKDKVDIATTIYISFVFLNIVLLFFENSYSFLIGRVIALVGGSIFYIELLMTERKKTDKEAKLEMWRKLYKAGKIDELDRFEDYT